MWLEIRSGAEAGRRVQVQGGRFTVAARAPTSSSRTRRSRGITLTSRTWATGPSRSTTRLQQRHVRERPADHADRRDPGGNEQIQFGDTVLQASANGGPATAPVPPGGGLPAGGIAPSSRSRRPSPTRHSSPPRRCLTSPQPIAGAPPARTQSAIQRITTQRQVFTRATRIGIAAIILLLIAIAVGAFAILSGGDDDGGAPTTAEVVENVTPLTTFIASGERRRAPARDRLDLRLQNGYCWPPTRTSSPWRGNQYRVGVTLDGGKQSRARRSSSVAGCPRTRPSSSFRTPTACGSSRSPSSRS